MIRRCLLSRSELVELIKRSPRTRDGYYYFPRFQSLLELPGTICDNVYYYDRSVFRNKICFDYIDLNAFLSTKKVHLDFELRRFIDSKLKDTLQGLESLSLYDIVKGHNFTLEELIDTTIYLTKYKLS